MKATFDRNDHALTAGWATYHIHRGWRAVFCLLGHQLPPMPGSPNGNSPTNYARCRRCRGFMKWFVVGQHRYGGMNR